MSKNINNILNELEDVSSTNERLIQKRMDIGTQIARYIREQGITQKEVAKRADVGESQLSDIMGGIANPTLNTLVKIEEALNRDIVVAPSFYEEDMVREGFTSVSVKHKVHFKKEVEEKTTAFSSCNIVDIKTGQHITMDKKSIEEELKQG